MSERIAGMPVEGCSEDQRRRAAALSGVGRRLAAAASRVGEPGPSSEWDVDLRSPAMLEFMAELEGFEARRRMLREDLERMAAERR